jgi:hypothetical protein
LAFSLVLWMVPKIDTASLPSLGSL